MRADIDDAILSHLNNTPSNETDLSKRLRDWGLHDDPAQIFEAWQVWKAHHVLPYSGGWLEQPWWVREDFATLNAVEAWHQLQQVKPDIPKENPFNDGRKH